MKVIPEGGFTLKFTDENNNRVRNIDKINEKLQKTGLPFKIVYHKGSYPGRRPDTVWWTVEKLNSRRLH